DSPVQGQEYFLSEASKVSETLFQMLAELNPALKQVQRPAPPHALAVRFADPQTMVVADLVPMKSFLKVIGRPELKSQPPSAAEAAPKPPEGGEGAGPGGMPGMMGRGGPGG